MALTLTPNALYQGTYDFKYSAYISDEFLNSPDNFLHSRYAGSSNSIPLVNLQEIVNYPEYAFLTGIIRE